MDEVIEARKPDIVFINKKNKNINVAIIGNQNIIFKEQEKLDKHQKSRIEYQICVLIRKQLSLS